MESAVNDRPVERRGVRAAVIALLVLAVAAAGPVRAAEVLDRVIAVVSGTVLMLSDVRAAITLGLVDTGGARDPVEVAMRWLIDRQLVLDEAGRSNATAVDRDALDQALAAVRKRFASESDFRRALSDVGLDDDKLRRLVRDTLIARQYAARRVDSVLPATDEELKEYYASHAERFVRNGLPVPFDEALADVTAVLQQERRNQAESAWMDRLRRRAEIREVYRSPR